MGGLPSSSIVYVAFVVNTQKRCVKKGMREEVYNIAEKAKLKSVFEYE